MKMGYILFLSCLPGLCFSTVTTNKSKAETTIKKLLDQKNKNKHMTVEPTLEKMREGQQRQMRYKMQTLPAKDRAAHLKH